ncbi:MAG TPA: nicotinamide-nucleotide amidohydrolase family protein [Chromobacteriaceae bacterium]|nr:nicotinamide-nucleotide amidohydrolase family protein [Chromobacteriaceae bacterium]
MVDNIQLAACVGASLLARGESVCTAESCTGGLIASALTEVSGSSAWFGYGVVTYSNDAKQRLLGAQSAALQEHGAVSEAVVRQMVAGACRLSGADWAVAVSGVAGPSGGTPEKPVGTVWFALQGPDGRAEAFVRHFSGDRYQVRQQTVTTALQALLDRLTSDVAQA